MYYILATFSYFLSFLPDSALKLFAKALSFVLYDLFGFRRKVVIQNVNQAFSSRKSRAEILEISKRSYYEVILTFIETLISFNPQRKKDVIIENKKVIDDILAGGTGCYLLVCHLGNWEAAASAFSSQVARARVVVKKVGGDSTDRFLTELRAKNNFEVIHKRPKGAAVRTIFKTIGENLCVGVMLDQHTPGERYIDFFGKPARTNSALATVWRRKKAPVVPVYIQRLDFNKHKLVIGEPLKLQNTEDKHSDILSNCLIFNKSIESMIEQCPEQYFWFHKRWK